MSLPVGATAGAGAAAAAAAAAKKARQEEEEFSNYTAQDLDGWEFKFLRSNWGVFKNQGKLQLALQEEAKHGWELVEMIDRSRVRLKRQTSARSKDQFVEGDPYRTTVGMNSGKLGLVITSVILGVVLLGLAVAFLIAQSGSALMQ